ncbi:hypothetical protein HYH02_009713 [Chlamydomonas schloesseri]|uniref:Radial spoke protein 17 n=1 Tax=Chlamydomonas schloesseri TaxID=2026947 RepID=A0A835W8Z8_9CHLO|nr:hypothetical protein HYH02_009713 [Chlamydomonas schloesseri]|eukprot:KAG2442229.1 hypothetical protein HYH02_009713 [Chlamydomonas schloesseri]
MPWLRYFFPKDFDLREGQPVQPYYQFFDVVQQPLQEDTSVPPPDWAPNAFFQLSFTQVHVPKDMVLATRIPRPPPPPDGSIDVTADNAHILKPGNEKIMADILAFCRSVATFRARTWKDALPLVDLLRGVLMHLLNHYTWGAALVREQAKKDAEAALAAEKKALKAWYDKQLEEAMARAREEYDEKLEARAEELRMTLAEDLTLQLRAERDEKNQLRAQVASLESQLKKASEAQLTLNRNLEHLQQQLELEARRRAEALAGKDAQMAAMGEQAAALRRRLAAAQGAVVEALGAKTKEDALNVAVKALAGVLPMGSAAYVAELRTAADVDGDDPSAALLAQAAAAPEPAALPPALAALRGVTPGFMVSPLAALVAATNEQRAASQDGEGAAAAAAAGRRRSSATGAGANLAAVISGAALNEIKESLVFKYIKASKGHEFMVGEKLAWGSGASWEIVERGTPALVVPDVAAQGNMWFFRHKQPPAAPGGNYMAVPILGTQGEVVGILAADTMGAAAAEAATAAAAAGGADTTLGARAAAAAAAASDTSAADAAFMRGLATAIGARARADAEAYHEAVLAAAMAGEEAPEPEPSAVDPAQFVVGASGEAGGEGGNLSGGLKLFSEALVMLRQLTDEELQALRDLDEPDDVTLAVIKSILAAVGEIGGGEDWAAARQHLSRELLERLMSMDPQAAWAEWQALCRAFRPLNELSLASLDAASTAASDPSAAPSVRASGAFARWAAGVRAISAARALQQVLEAKLQKANAALMKTFNGDSCNALTELRSYRVPPPLTFGVLQCVLMLSGNVDEEDCRNWARMRTLANYRLIKRLVTLRPAQVPRKIFRAVKRLVHDIVEGDVKQESVATLSLYRWLSDFTRLASVAK